MKTLSAMTILAVAGLATTASARPAYNGAGFNIPDNTVAGNQSSLAVGDAFSITDITVTVTFGTGTGASGKHTWVGDLTATLTGPGGSITLFQRAGATTSASAGDSSDCAGAYTFSDAAPAAPTWWGAAFTAGAAVALPVGSYRSSQRSGTFTYQENSLLGVFGSTGSLGNWTLKITDSAGGDTGGISSWTLNLAPTPGAASLLGLGGVALLRRRR